MRTFIFAALSALALVCPAYGQTQSIYVNGIATPATTGTLTTGSTDAVMIAAQGWQWATVRFTVVTAGTSTSTTQISLDGGVNWITSAYARRLDQSSANPQTFLVSNTTFSSGQIYEVPLPSNSTKFRVLCGASGTTTTIQVSGGIPYVPGSPVVAVLYDVTSGTNAALDTSTLDVSGWTTVGHAFSMSGGAPAFSLAEVDDAGATLGNLVTGTAAFSGGLGVGAVVGGTAGLVAATAQIPLLKRLRYQSAAIAAQTSRIRIVSRR